MRFLGPAACAALVVVAGCAGTDPAEPGQHATSAPPPAPPPVVNETAGSIAGKVLSDEQLPVVGARVFLRERSGIVETDEVGNFTFNGLEQGVYTVVADKLGYEAIARKVPVEFGQVTHAIIVLKPVAVLVEGYTRSVPLTGYINLGHAYLDYYAAWHLLNTCSKCEFYVHFDPNPKDVKFEASWVKPFDASVLAGEIFYDTYKNWVNSTIDSGTRVVAGYWYYTNPHPRNMEAGDNKTLLDNSKGLKTLQVRIGGGFYSVAYEQKVDMWMSFAYRQPFPDNFTAFPPKA